MIATIFGVLTACAAIGWGVRWYSQQREQETRRLPDPPVQPSSMTRPLVQSKVADQVMQRRVEPLASSSTDGSVEDDAPAARLLPAPEAGERVAPSTFRSISAHPPERSTDRADVPAETQGEKEEGAISLDEDIADVRPGESDSPLEALAEVFQQDDDGILGYCGRCRAKRYLEGVKYARTKKGKPAIRGTCVICGSSMLIFTSEQQWHMQQKPDEQT
ncbi:MAG: DUF5679 domain-containing protein [Ardenticatenaceae bacterium]